MAPVTRSQASSSSSEVLARTLRSASNKAKETVRSTTKREFSTCSDVRTRTLRSRASGAKQPEKRPFKWSKGTTKTLKAEQNKMIQEFLEVFHANPKDYAVYGSEDWVHDLIKHMKVAPPFEILPSVLRNWMKTESVFDKANRIHGYIPVRKAARGVVEVVARGDDVRSPLEPNQDVVVDCVKKPEVVIAVQLPPEVPAQEPVTNNSALDQRTEEVPCSTASLPVPEDFLDFESIARRLADLMPGERMADIYEFLENLRPEDLLE